MFIKFLNWKISESCALQFIGAKEWQQFQKWDQTGSLIVCNSEIKSDLS